MPATCDFIATRTLAGFLGNAVGTNIVSRMQGCQLGLCHFPEDLQCINQFFFFSSPCRGLPHVCCYTGREGKMSPCVNDLHLKKASNAYTIRTQVWEVFCFFVEIPQEGCSGLDNCEGRNSSAGMMLPALACPNPSLSHHCSLSPDTCPHQSETHPSSWILLQSNVCYSRADTLSYKCQ